MSIELTEEESMALKCCCEDKMKFYSGEFHKIRSSSLWKKEDHRDYLKKNMDYFEDRYEFWSNIYSKL